MVLPKTLQSIVKNARSLKHRFKPPTPITTWTASESAYGFDCALPYDVFLLIVELLADAPQALFALSLTCHSALYVSRRTLFSTISLLPCNASVRDFDPAAQPAGRMLLPSTLYLLLQTSPYIGSYVRTLFCYSHPSNFDEEVIPELYCRFINVKEITLIHHFDLDPDSDETYDTTSMYMTQQDWTSIPISFQQALRHLFAAPTTLSSVSVYGFENIPPNVFSNPSIERLLLHCTLSPGAPSPEDHPPCRPRELSIIGLNNALYSSQSQSHGLQGVDFSKLESFDTSVLSSKDEDMVSFVLNNSTQLRKLRLAACERSAESVAQLYRKLPQTSAFRTIGTIWISLNHTTSHLIDCVEALAGMPALQCITLVVTFTKAKRAVAIAEVSKLDSILADENAFPSISTISVVLRIMGAVDLGVYQNHAVEWFPKLKQLSRLAVSVELRRCRY